MATKTWRFALGDGPHSVVLSDDLFWGRRRVQIDGGPWQPLLVVRKQFSLDRDSPVSVGGHDGSLRITRVGAAYRYELFVDGLSVETGLRPAPVPPVPWWGWVFVALCGLLLAGGILGAAAGVYGGILCYGVARDTAQPPPVRILICFGVTIVCWIVYLVMATLFQTLLHLHRPQ